MTPNSAPKKIGRLRKILRIVLTGIAVLVVGAIAVYVWSRAAPLTPAQREALELLRKQPPYPGRNAFAALWLLDRDTPTNDDAVQAIAATDARSFAERMRETNGGLDVKEDDGVWTAPSASRFARLLKSREGDPAWCKPVEWMQCLQQVRAEPDAYAELLERHKALSSRIDALAQYERYESGFAPSATAPLPPFQHLLSLPLTRQALAIAQGDAASALRLGCDNLQLGTMLATRSRDLVSGMVGAKLIAAQAQALAWITAAFPDQAIPENCVPATAALPVADFDLCPHMHGVWEDHRSMMFPAGRISGASILVLDVEKTLARYADAYAETCRATARQHLLRDLPVPDPPAESSSLLNRECLANLVGCKLSDIARPTFAGYQRRLQDAWAIRQALRSLLWLHAQPQAASLLEARDGANLFELLAQRPQDMQTPARRSSVTAQADGSLVFGVPLYSETYRQQFGADTLPLPLTVAGD